MADPPPLRGALALLVAAALSAWLIPGHAPGLGAFLSGLAVGAAVVLARVRRPTAWQVVAGVVTASLGATVVLVDAAWTVALTTLAALALGAVAITNAATWSECLVGLLVAAWRSLRGPASVVQPLAGALRQRPGGWNAVPALRAAILTAVLVGIFGALFASADRAFAVLLEEHLLPDWRLHLWPARIAVLVTALALGGGLATAPRMTGAVRLAGRQHLRPAEWITALSALDVLVAGFVAVQLTVLFGGHDHVLRTSGLTYAEYARSGFFQLLVAALLTLAVVAGAVRWASLRARSDRWVLQVLLGTLCSLTLVVLASALRRLSLYEEAFGFTRARLLAHGVIWWLAASFVLVLIAGACWRGSWLPRAAIVLTAIVAVTFAWLQPDRLVAERNVARYERTGQLDLGYLAGLSIDAVPALVRLPADLRACALQGHRADLTEADPWTAYNWSRARARRLLAEVEAVACRE